MAFGSVVLYYLGKKTDQIRLSQLSIGIRNNARNRMRSITLIGLLACGLFIVFTVGANRLNALKDAERRDSGTGGFALYGETSIPVLYDLNTIKGKQFYGLNAKKSEGVSYVQFRVKEGDDASCLNLNRVSTPQLIGVVHEELTRRDAFTFAEMTDEVDPENPWMVLAKSLPEGQVPAVADLTVIVWGLGKAVGDTLIYTDEKGDTFNLKLVGGLANSVFQGNIIISEETFIQKYPSSSGYRIFLLDAPPENVAEVRDNLTWAMQDQGLDLVPASTRLAEFNTVQNTYLSIFLILGSFGLLLGSVGLGIVVWRNVHERRGELALLRAVGFAGKSVRAILLSEHIALLIAGIFFGFFAALLATLPTLLTPGAEIPYPTILIILIIVGLNGVIWTYSVWKTSLPSWSAATPIIWGNRVFIISPSKSEPAQEQPEDQSQSARRKRRSALDPGGPNLLLLCISKKDGKILWERELDNKNQIHRKQNDATPSPMTDGKHVWAVTGTGKVAAFDMEGKPIWKKDLQKDYGPFGHNWGYGSSPLLHDGSLIIEVLHGMKTDDPSYIVSLDAETGKVQWYQERPTDAQRESPDAYTTPVILEHEGKIQIVISGGDYVTGHDFKTGKEVWRAGGLNPLKRPNYRVVPTPIAGQGTSRKAILCGSMRALQPRMFLPL